MQNNKRHWFLIPLISLGSLVLLALVAFFSLEYYATTVLQKEIDSHIQDISEYVRVDYESMGVNWLAFTVDLKKVKLSKPPLPGIITIDKVAVRDFTSIGIRWIPTVVVLDNILCTNDDFKIAARRLATSFSLSRIPTEEEIGNNWKVLVDNLLAGDLNLNNLVYSDQDIQLDVEQIKTNYSLSGGNHKNIGLAIDHSKFQLGDVRLDSQAFQFAATLDQNNVLTHLAKKVKEFSFQFPSDLAKSNPFFENLAALGYDRLALGVDVNYDYQPETKNLNLKWDTSAADMGRLQFDLHLTDYHSPPVPVDGSLARLLNFLEQLRTPAERASLQGFTVLYQDYGLAPRLIKAEAQSAGQTPEAFTRSLVGTINTSLAILPLPAAIKEQVNSVNRFLQNPQEIQLTITCRKPVRLNKLGEGSVAGFLELLNNTEVKITAK